MESGQILTAAVILAVLGSVALGPWRIEIPALAGLFLLGILGVAPAGIIFTGFGHPALITIVAVFLMSQGIISSQALRGLGQALSRKVHSTRGQIISLAGLAALLSAFMNNVGAIGLMLPTAVRMAGRKNVSPGTFGLPLATGSILGGSLTLIGSAPNIIIASYMVAATGQSFKMFDYAPHGAAMLVTAVLLWMICRTCGMDPGAGENPRQGVEDAELQEVITFAPLATREKRITLAVIMAAVIPVSLGLLHPALGFGTAALLLLFSGVLKPSDAYHDVNWGIVFFLGSMLGLGQVLEHTGATEPLSNFLTAQMTGLSPFFIILMLVFVTSALSNAINNAAAAVFMAPLALGLAAANQLETAAALMAVAAGANLTLLLPTHQGVLLVMSMAPFPRTSFIRAGWFITLFCGLAAAVTIALVWQ